MKTVFTNQLDLSYPLGWILPKPQYSQLDAHGGQEQVCQPLRPFAEHIHTGFDQYIGSGSTAYASAGRLLNMHNNIAELKKAQPRIALASQTPHTTLPLSKRLKVEKLSVKRLDPFQGLSFAPM